MGISKVSPIDFTGKRKHSGDSVGSYNNKKKKKLKGEAGKYKLLKTCLFIYSS